MMKKLNLIKTLLILALGFGLCPRVYAQAEMPDFEYYKKYGNHSKSWDDSVQKGFEAYDKQNCDETLTNLKEAIAAQCQDALVFYKMAVCSEVAGSPYTALQYYQLAEEKLQKLTPVHRYHKDIYESYGRALFQAKKFDQAYSYLSRAAALGTPSFSLYYMVGYLNSQKGDANAAIELFEKALSQDTTGVAPTTLGGVYREVGKAYYMKKDYKKATELLSKAVSLNPQDQEASKLQSEIAALNQQNSMVQMLNTMTNEGKTLNNNSAPGISAPPPPAAAKLPPLNGGSATDPMPPLGTPVSPTAPSSTAPLPQAGGPATVPVTLTPSTSTPSSGSSTTGTTYSTTPSTNSGPPKLEPLPQSH